MQVSTSEMSVSARFAALTELMQWLEREANMLESDQVKRMQLVTEELFANSINHGYGTECDATISLVLNIDAERVNLIYRDSAKPFDLLSAQPLPASTDRIGGIGLNLIRALASAIRYQYKNGHNIIELDFSRDKACLPKGRCT